MSAVRRILVGTDLEPRSEGAIRYAHFLSGQLDAAVVAVHVTSSRDIDVTEPTHHPKPQAAIIESTADAKLHDQLRDVLGDAADEVATEVRFGDPLEEILAAARDHEADMIVVTVESRSRVGKLLMGSHAQQVLLASQLPVVAVKPGWTPVG
jgi:nucleotide-binding universal stress UspA family protein